MRGTRAPLNEDHDGLPPPGCEADRHPLDDAVAAHLAALERISLGVEVAYNTDNVASAMARIATNSAAPGITPAHRDQLMGGIEAARANIVDQFVGADRQLADADVDALVTLAVMWSETPDERAARDPDARADARDCARHLANMCENINLLENITRRQVSADGPLRSDDKGPSVSSGSANALDTETAVAFAEAAVRHFEDIVSARIPVYALLTGLDYLLYVAASRDDLPAIAAHLAEPCRAALHAGAPIIADATAETLSAERVFLSLGTAAGLLSCSDPLRWDRLLHTALLNAELRAFVYRGEIQRRNDPLGRYVAARQAWDLPPGGDPLQ